MDLADLPGNPAPAGAVISEVITADGARIRAARFPATVAEARGTILLLQGRAEQIEKYAPVIEGLRARHFAVVTFDWRGQGGSVRRLRNPRKGHVRSMAQYEADLDAVRHKVVEPHCPAPYFLLAHSMGGLVALSAAPRLTGFIDRMVLTAPFLDFGPGPFRRPAIRRLARLMVWCGLGRMFIPGPLRRLAVTDRFEDNPLTSDEASYRRMMSIVEARRDLSVGAPTNSWILAMARALDRVDADGYAESLRVPALLFNCSADRMVSVAAIERMARRLRGAGHVLVPGARHELLMERDAFTRQFWAAFDAFVPGSAEPQVTVPAAAAAPEAPEPEPAGSPQEAAAPPAAS